MDFNMLSTQNWSRMFNVWIEDIQVVCHPVVIAPFELQHCFLRKVRTLARYTSVIVIALFSLHCTRPRALASQSRKPAQTKPLPEWTVPADVFSEVGEASWYGGNGDGFAGRPTASGIRYEPSALTCAHRTLPFGTHVEVENMDSGRRVVVEVNDRGPFIRGRILDLSRRAAAELDMLGAGTATVRIRTVDASGRPVPVDPATEAENPYTIQVAALADPANIERLSQEMEGHFGPVTLQDAASRDGLAVKRVRVGSFSRLEEAQRTAEKVAKFFRDRKVEPFVTRIR